ncbi:PilX N-terminal domain-containing pilus assembly protein [Marinobacter sp. G11]|uniref:pilus assembly PilX family protein n=1 Tax=Marinobacter sp. G11 TaxID=2903522 RepID=UPI001E468710|nr:PilX N-terminal domain-containing pilus assembly protein [Marinobacter sp. G11]MCE0758776.1 PilX N-terminal domain-containing pilus assembly protein [Marinobacter sp. G11]
MNKLNRNALRSQRGAATLLITVTILVLITLVSFYTSRSVLMEQRITNADARSKEAFQAAEAGIRRAMAYLTEDMDRDDNGEVDPLVIGSDGENPGTSNVLPLESGATTTITLFGPDDDLSGSPSVIPTDDDDFRVTIRSVGLAADGSATRTVWQTIAKIDPLPNVPNNPLTTKGTAVIGGAAKVTNPEGHSTIWAGGNVDLSQNNASETNIANPTNPDYPACMDDVGGCKDSSGDPDVIQSSTRDELGLDVVEYDSNLSSLSEVEFFRNFFGMSPKDYRKTMVTKDLLPAEAGTTDGMKSEVIWIEGDPSFGSNSVIGTEDKPVILIIDGEPSFSGTPVVNGIVVVLGDGDVSGNGNVLVNGAFIASSDSTDFTGSLEVMYNSSVLQKTRNSGPVAASSGGWRDFENN